MFVITEITEPFKIEIPVSVVVRTSISEVSQSVVVLMRKLRS